MAGIDISPPDDDSWVLGAVVVLKWPGLQLAEVQISQAKPLIPYIPGYLSFREIPAAFDALEKLQLTLDVILVDGQRDAHPHRFALICYLGLVTEVPTIGCAKSRLLGRYETLDAGQGASSLLIDNGDAAGKVVRTRTDVLPVYVSVMHKVSIVLKCCWKYHLPETTRFAHLAATG